MPAYIPPYLGTAQQNDRSPSPLPQRRVPQPAMPPRPATSSGANSTDNDVPVWRRRSAAGLSSLSTPPAASTRDLASNSAAAFATGPSPPALNTRVQTPNEAYRYRTYKRICLMLQPKPIKAEQCEEDKEYAQWAGGYVEVTDKLLSTGKAGVWSLPHWDHHG